MNGNWAYVDMWNLWRVMVLVEGNGACVRWVRLVEGNGASVGYVGLVEGNGASVG